MYVVSERVYKKAKEIRNQIKEMMSVGQETKNKLGGVNDIVNGGMKQYCEELKDSQSRRNIVSSCEALADYLKDYIEQGNAVLKDIEECQNTMVKQLKA